MPRMSLAVRCGPGWQLYDSALVDIGTDSCLLVPVAPSQPAPLPSPAPTPTGLLLDVEEAAVYVGLPAETLRTWAARGHMPVVRLKGDGTGRRPMLRFRKTDLDQWVERQAVAIRVRLSSRPKQAKKEGVK